MADGGSLSEVGVEKNSFSFLGLVVEGVSFSLLGLGVDGVAVVFPSDRFFFSFIFASISTSERQIIFLEAPKIRSSSWDKQSLFEVPLQEIHLV